MHNNITLINGDCRDFLKQLEDKSADLVITSPPYNMNLRISGDRYCSRQIVKEFSTKYRHYPDNLPVEEYYQLNRQVVKECLRIADIVFYNVQFLTGNKRSLFRLIGHFNEKLKEIIVWDKLIAQPAMSSGVLNSRFEVLLVFSDISPISRKFETAQWQRGMLENLWTIKRGKKIYKSHGAVFPIELVSTIIENFSTDDAVILDPFMGTGTTGVAAKTLQRDFIGIELDRLYYKIAKRRIFETTKIN